MGDDRFIAIKGDWKGRNGDVYLACIYGPHVSRYKASLWERLSGLMNNFSGAWCISGDLNVVRRSDDRFNSQVNVREMRDFNDFINDSRLVEIPMGGRNLDAIAALKAEAARDAWSTTTNTC
ncbi:hypothetical protein CTI12_AA431780 [Artemisia annua]|uniref:RNA-directed DNA polymerase, eukaryota n=1 Tax=Artemisia annua TaxID=35608 RepID=A0A2U1M122_ARTAN|nr:hypothetical protein CTI12_AA431780 [Artemisia annua]